MVKFSSQYVAINCDNGAFVRLTITGIKNGPVNGHTNQHLGTDHSQIGTVSIKMAQKKVKLESLKTIFSWDRGGGGQVVCILVFYSDNASSNPTEYSFYSVNSF